MNRITGKSWQIAYLLLILMLITAQTGAMTHAYEHDPGTPQDRTCSSCLTAAQLLGANIDGDTNQLVLPPKDPFRTGRSTACESVTALIPRQRGPPRQL